MSIRTIILAAAVPVLACVPAVALADLQVNANGFHRVVVGSMQNGNCHVHRADGGRTVRCPDGTRGTLTLYQHHDSAPACEIDFWYQNGAGRPWHIQLSHQNAASGNCTTQWQNDSTLNVSLTQ